MDINSLKRLSQEGMKGGAALLGPRLDGARWVE